MAGAVEVAGLFVVAANRLLREALVRLLSGKGDLRIRGAEQFSPATVVQIASLRPDVVVLSPAWNELDFRSTHSIHKAVPDVKILMIEMEDDEGLFLKAVQAGALGYLLKDASARELVEAVRRLAQNLVVCPTHLERALFKLVASVSASNFPAPSGFWHELTPREQKLLALLAQGLTNKEIGVHLSLSEYTVKNHVHRILRKTGASNRMALAHLAVTQIPQPEGSKTDYS